MDPPNEARAPSPARSNGGSLKEAPPSDEIERLARALQDPTRRQILLALLRDGRPRTVDEVAGLTGIHRTVAFDHLERLSTLGYLTRSRRRGRVGKPAGLYTASIRSLSTAYPARQFVTLAGLLAGGLATMGADGVGAARSAGVRFGGQLASGDAPSVVDALAPLQSLGADYAVEGDRINAANCVFLEACAAASEVVCGLHAGILEGALRGAGLDARVEPAGLVSPSACAFDLRPHGPPARLE